MKLVNSKVVINQMAINHIKKSACVALEQTGDYLLDEVVQAEVIPFDKGTLQNESTYVNKDNSNSGLVRIISSRPYARRLYYHPEYNFKTDENANAKGKWFDDWTEKGNKSHEIKKAFSLLLKKRIGE